MGAGVALDVWSYSSLIKGFVQSSELQFALEILQEMKEASHVTANEVLLLLCCLYAFLHSNVHELSLHELSLHEPLAWCVISPMQSTARVVLHHA